MSKELDIENAPFEIRRYQSGDKQAVFDLHVKALKATSAIILSGEWDRDFAAIEEVYLKKGGEFLVVLFEGRIIGMGALRRVDETCGEIKRMRVDPTFQGRGIVQTLLDLLTNRARDFGYRKLILDTTVNQIAAFHLYIKNGFKEVRRGILGGLETIFFEKNIDETWETLIDFTENGEGGIPVSDLLAKLRKS